MKTETSLTTGQTIPGEPLEKESTAPFSRTADWFEMHGRIDRIPQCAADSTSTSMPAVPASPFIAWQVLRAGLHKIKGI